jgi:tetratricopeptide (TPR) repeat protein
MRRIIILIVVVLLLGGGGVYYYKLGGSPDVKRDRALGKARKYMAEAKVREAILEYRNALSADPRSAEAHYEFGMALLRQGDGQAGYRELVRAKDLKPDFSLARYRLGIMYVANKDIKRANDELEKIRERDKDAKEGYYLAAQIALAERQPDVALKALESVLNKESNQASIYVDIGHVHITKKEYLAAESAYRKALEIDPKFHGARVALSRLYSATGKQEQAEQELLIATKADPENENLLHVLGIFYSRSRRFDDLEKLYEDLLKKKPDSSISKKRLVEINFLQNDSSRAKQLIN